jgi:hypothetical protein
MLNKKVVRIIETLKEMKTNYEQAKLDLEKCESNFAKLAINHGLYKLKSDIEKEEYKINDNKVETIDNKYIDIPVNMNWVNSKKHDVEVVDNVIYVYEKFKYDKDGSFHLNHYAWIPQNDDKYVLLNISTLGGDVYGERYFLEARYYKHPSSHHSYLSKGIYTNNAGYRPYYLHVFEKLGLERKRNNYKSNLLQWANNDYRKNVEK